MKTSTDPRGRLEGLGLRLLRRNDKGAVVRTLLALMRRLARCGFAAGPLAWLIRRNLRPLGPVRKDAIRIIVLNEERYRPDLEELARHPGVMLFGLPSSLQSALNAVCLHPIREQSNQDSTAFELETTPEIHRARENLRRFLVRILDRLRRSGFDGLMTCTFYYTQDRDWDMACTRLGMPFSVLHKENMKDPVTHKAIVPFYRQRHRKMIATRIFLANAFERQILVASEAVAGDRLDRISIVGSCRMDRIFRIVSEGKLAPPRRQVTLFSSHHCLGLLTLKTGEEFFSSDPEEGFVRWFDVVHGAMGRLALENPDAEVWIKPKWMDRWADEIARAIRAETGRSVDTIPNLHVSIERPAQQLIEESAVVAGLNSTTLLEAKLFDRPVVVPLLEEAAGKYFDSHVYFHRYLDDVFHVARSQDQFLELLKDGLEGRLSADPMPEEMIHDYLGYFDGHVTDRVVEIMRNDVEKMRGLSATRVG